MTVIFSGIMDKDKTSGKPDTEWTYPSAPNKYCRLDYGDLFAIHGAIKALDRRRQTTWKRNSLRICFLKRGHDERFGLNIQSDPANEDQGCKDHNKDI